MGERILVVDDDEHHAAIVRDGLTYHGYDVAVVGDGLACLTAVRSHPPQLVLLDRMLPGMDGVEVCRQLRALDGPPVIMLTVRDALAEKIDGLESGADDYLTKPFALEELVARVRVVLRRFAPRLAALRHVADLTLDTQGRRVWRGQRPIDLTAREFDLLDYLMRHAGQVLSPDVLLEGVWGYDGAVASNVVRVYITYVRQKLNAAGEPDLIHAVRGVGYVLRE